MSASVVDLNRTLPQNALTIAAPLPPKPVTRFDDVLANQQNRAKPADPKPKDDAKPADTSAKSDKSDKADKTKSKDDDKKVDSADHHDDTDETKKADPDDAAAEAAKSSDGKPAAKSTDAKKTKDDDSDDADTTTETGDQADASGTKTPAVPTDTPATDGKPVDTKADGTKKPAKADKDNDETTKPDPATLAAQLNPQQPTPQLKADAKPKNQGDSDAATDATAAVTAGAKRATTAAKPDTTEATDGPTDPKAKLAVQPKGSKAATNADADADAQAAANAVVPDTSKPAIKSDDSDTDDAAAALQAVASSEAKPTQHVALPAVPTAQQPAAPQKTVAEDNVDRIVTSVRGELLTKGGSMTIRLDPPSLGAINVQINVDNGVMSAQLQTTNDDATKLLSHNLAQLKNSLEAVGVTVDKIQVKQAAPAETNNSSQSGSDGERRSSDGATQDQSARQEQQRREMLQRMWAKLSGSGDPLDLVA